MRPRKVILLCCDSISRERELRFVLNTRSFFVMTPEDVANGIYRCPDAVMVVQATETDRSATYAEKWIKRSSAFRDAPVLFLSDVSVYLAQDISPDVFLPKRTCIAEMYERLMVMTTRRRGPRKRAWEAVAA